MTAIDKLVLSASFFLLIFDIVLVFHTIFAQELSPKERLIAFLMEIIFALPLGRCLKLW